MINMWLCPDIFAKYCCLLFKPNRSRQKYCSRKLFWYNVLTRNTRSSRAISIFLNFKTKYSLHVLGAYSIHLLFSEHTVYVCFDFESFCCCNFSGATLTEMFSNENNAPLLLRGRSIKTGILCILLSLQNTCTLCVQNRCILCVQNTFTLCVQNKVGIMHLNLCKMLSCDKCEFLDFSWLPVELVGMICNAVHKLFSENAPQQCNAEEEEGTGQVWQWV